MAPARRGLVIRLSSLGDVALTFPALGPVARALGAPLAFVTTEPWAPLVRRHPDVGAVIPVETRRPRRLALREAARRINAEVKPDVVFDWHGVARARALAAAVRSPVKVTYPKYAFGRWLLATAGVDVLPTPTVRVPALYARAAAPWGVTAPAWDFRLPPSPAASALRVPPGLSAGMAALAPGAYHGAKAWPPAHWRALARELTAAGRRVLLLGSAAERPLCEEVAAGVEGAVNAAGAAADAGELPELLRGAAFVVTNDSAWAHLAPLVDTPALVLFGPTSPRFGFAPWGPHDRYLYLGAPCSPCSKHGARACWRARRECLEDVGPGRVLAELAAMGVL